MSIKKIVVFGDVHLEQDVPIDPSYIVVKKFLKSFKPDTLVINGDLIDFSYLSSYVANSPGLTEGKRLKKDILDVHAELKYLASTSKNVIYTMGNHSRRAQTLIESNPILEGLVDLPILLQLEDLGIEWVPENKQPYNIIKSNGNQPGLYVMHGEKCGVHFTRQVGMQYNASIIVNHTHRHQVFTRSITTSPNEPPFIQEVYGNGCLTGIRQDWHKSKDFQHTNGFTIIEHDTDTNNWTAIPIVIKNGCFIYAGKLYQA